MSVGREHPEILNAGPGPLSALDLALLAGRVYRLVRAGAVVGVLVDVESEAAVVDAIRESGLVPRRVDAADLSASAGGGVVGILTPESGQWGRASLDERDAEPTGEPLRIGLLGLGTVGRGLVARLASRAAAYRVDAVLVRTPEHHAPFAARHLGGALLSADPDAVLDRPLDTVVELIGGIDRARASIERAICGGRHVVTANKALIAADGPRLSAMAAEHGVRVLHSAAVGGGMPAIETVTRAARHAAAAGDRLVSIDGVLNGTCNYLVNRLASGDGFEAAVAEAQRLGYAEADPTMDLDGADAAQKLIILARLGLGVEVPIPEVRRDTLDAAAASRIAARAASGETVRQVARLSVGTGGEIEATVAYRAVEPGSALFDLPGALNALRIGAASGRSWRMIGSGAGGGPTSASVMADLEDLARGDDQPR